MLTKFTEPRPTQIAPVSVPVANTNQPHPNPANHDSNGSQNNQPVDAEPEEWPAYLERYMGPFANAYRQERERAERAKGSGSGGNGGGSPPDGDGGGPSGSSGGGGGGPGGSPPGGDPSDGEDNEEDEERQKVSDDEHEPMDSQTVPIDVNPPPILLNEFTHEEEYNTALVWPPTGPLVDDDKWTKKMVNRVITERTLLARLCEDTKKELAQALVDAELAESELTTEVIKTDELLQDIGSIAGPAVVDLITRKASTPKKPNVSDWQPPIAWSGREFRKRKYSAQNKRYVLVQYLAR